MNTNILRQALEPARQMTTAVAEQAKAMAEHAAHPVVDVLESLGEAATSAADAVTDILSDPNASIEEKIQRLMWKLLQAKDAEINTQLKHIEKLQSGDTGGDGQGSTMDTATFYLNRLSTQRTQLFDTMSAVLATYEKSTDRRIQELAR